MSTNPEKYLRLSTILGNPKAIPPIDPIIPVCRATWYKNIKNGTYPKPIKISERVTVWKASDIYALRDFGTINQQK